MNHNFQPSSINAEQCNVCSRPFVDHTAFAQCEACHNKAECNVYENNMLLCWPCKDKQVGEVIAKYEQTIPAREQKLAELDNGAISYASFFNRETVAIAERQLQLGLSDEEYHKQLSNEIQNLQMNLIPELDEKKRQLYIELNTKVQYLRDLGAKVSAEVQAQLKLSDKNYQTTAKVVPKVKKENKTPMDRIIEAIALAEKISLEQAREKILKGQYGAKASDMKKQ